jgi:hypothetical protein
MADYCWEQLESQLNYCAEDCRKIAERSDGKTVHFPRHSEQGAASGVLGSFLYNDM